MQSTVQLVIDVLNNSTITALGYPIVLARYNIIYDGHFHVCSFILLVKKNHLPKKNTGKRNSSRN